MNYENIYSALVKRAQVRLSPDELTENHHILPKCLGGSNEPLNMVRLTLREHFLAHWLLHKMHPKSFGLLSAWNSFCMVGGNTSRVSSHLYEYARRKWIAALYERKTTHPDWWQNWTKGALGSVWMNNGKTSVRAKVAEIDDLLEAGYTYGRITFARAPHSAETRARMSERAKGRQSPTKGKKCETETRRAGIEKMRATRVAKGHFRSKEQQLADAQKAEKLCIVCSVCGKHGQGAGMRRWHFENCKFRKDDEQLHPHHEPLGPV